MPPAATVAVLARGDSGTGRGELEAAGNPALQASLHCRTVPEQVPDPRFELFTALSPSQGGRESTGREMCGVPEQSNTNCNSATTLGDSDSNVSRKMEISGPEMEDISILLEFAANNDLDSFREAIGNDLTKVYSVGAWYCRQNGTNHMVLEQRTPAMISALYGSLDVLKCILDAFDDPENINRRYGRDGSTALHCAASGGSERAVEAIKLLLEFGADLNIHDTMGRRPADVIAIHPRLRDKKEEMESILEAVKQRKAIRVDVPEGIESDLPAFVDQQLPTEVGGSPLSPSSAYSHEALNTLNANSENNREKDKEWHNNPSLPDIKNSIYMTDEFRMFSFKIRPCSRAYSHDWTECPFAHPGENARRRDPRRYHYSCVPCPDFRKGSCRQGDACEYAHGVFECWLHPAQYRTRLCKDGVECMRRVCFFAHTAEELRPLYISNGSSIPSPRTTSLDISAMSPPVAPSSPSTLMMNPFFSPTNSSQMNISTPPMSPSSPVNSRGGTWSPTVPALHLPGVSLQASRLRAALNARDILLEMPDLDNQLLNELSCLSPQALSAQALLNATSTSANGTASLRAGKYRNIGLNMQSSNHEDVFASDFVSSPRAMMHDSPRMSQMESEMQFHRSTQLQTQLQNAMQLQINSPVFSGMADQTQIQLKQAALDSKVVSSPRLHPSTPFSLGSLGRTSALAGLDSDRQNIGIPISPAMVATPAVLAQHDMRSHASHDLGAGLSLSGWGSPTGKAEWAVQRDDLLKFRNSSPFLAKVEEPDASWAHKSLTEGSLDDDTAENTAINRTKDIVDHTVLGSWIDDMHLDRIIA